MTDPLESKATHLIGRDEFESHQRSVNKSIDKMSSAITDLSASLREDIKHLAGAQSDVISKTTNQGFMVFSVILTAFAGLYAFMDSKVDTAKEANNILSASTNALLIQKLESYDLVQDEARRESDSQSKRSLEKEIEDLGTLLTTKIAGGNSESAARHESQQISLGEISRRITIIEEDIK